MSFEKLEAVIMDLKVSMDKNTETINRLEQKLIQEVSEVRQENIALRDKIKQLENANQAREDRDRRDNLVFFGIKKSVNKESWQDVESSLIDFVHHHFGIKLEHFDFVRAHRVGQKGTNQPIIAKFTHYKIKSDILSKASRLRGTPYSMYEDFSFETRKERKLLYQAASTIREETGGRKICKVSYRTLWAGGVPYHVDNNQVVKKNRKNIIRDDSLNKNNSFKNNRTEMMDESGSSRGTKRVANVSPSEGSILNRRKQYVCETRETMSTDCDLNSSTTSTETLRDESVQNELFSTNKSNWTISQRRPSCDDDNTMPDNNDDNDDDNPLVIRLEKTK